ncbi:PQQ-like beta-propeller repeat protein, partial [Exilibacterium tricleocarpae]
SEITYGFDPLSASDGLLDLDSDGYSNWQEVAAGTDPESAQSYPGNGTLLWELPTFDNAFKRPAVDVNGDIYFGSEDGSLYALDRVGNLKWVYSLGGDIESIPAVAEDGTIYFSGIGSAADSRTQLYALNSDGSLQWVSGGEFAPGSPAIGADGTVYVGAVAGNLYALNPDSSLKWTATTGRISADVKPLIAADGTIYISDNEGLFYAFDSDGRLKWSRLLTGGKSIAVGKDGTVFLGGSSLFGSSLYAVSPAGTVKWSSDFGDGFRSSIALGEDGTVYIGDSQKLYAISAQGILMWSYDPGPYGIPPSPVIGADGNIYISAKGTHALSPEGALLWSIGEGESSPIIGSDGTLYMGDYRTFSAVITGSGGLARTPWPVGGHDIYGSGDQCRSKSGYYSRTQDTDGDGAIDCWEFVYGLDPLNPNDGILDPDGDGLSNFEEILALTDNLKADTDGDGLSDGDEINIHNTGPTEKDSDHDGLNDGYEIAQGLDPLVGGEVLLDSDGDGFSDRQELQTGFDAIDPLSTPSAGMLQWVSVTDRRIRYSAPAIDEDGNIYIGTDNASLYRVYPDGRVKWSFKAGGGIDS